MPIDCCGLEGCRCDLMTTICSAGRGGTHDFSVDNLKAVLEEEKQSPAAAQDEGVDGKTAFPVDQTALRRVVGVDEGEVVL